jgi:hypothetical protein
MLLVLAVAAAGSRTSAAQDPNLQTVQPGTAAIWTDQSQYQVGSSIEYCFRIPIAGQVTITDILADGTSRVIFSGFGPANTPVCQTGVITPPEGTECLRLTYPLLGGNGQTQTCFSVVGGEPPPPPGNLAIFTDRTRYRIGDLIRGCYTVPGPGPITIIDMLPDGQTQVLIHGYDDGTGACHTGTVTPPPGIECLTLQYTYPSGMEAAAQACFEVIGTTPPPPSDWFNVGSALVDESGNWNYNEAIQINTTYTYVQVNSGDCGATTTSNLVWESNLQRQPQSNVGVDVWAGNLDPVGLSVSSGGGGYATISRPVTANPTTQANLTLHNVGTIYNGTRLNVCFRTP